jgi:hypothetical protein
MNKKKAELLKQINETKAKLAALRENESKVRAFGLAKLMESELDKATLVLSVKGISDELQQMAEKVAKMEAEEIMPILDSLKEAFGPELAESFNNAASQNIRNLVEAIKAAKDAIGNEVLRLEGAANGEQVNDMAMAPADDMGMDDMGADNMDDMGADPMANDMGGEDMDDMDGDMDDMGGSEIGAEDDLSDDDLLDPAAGRARKESAEFRHASNPDKFVFEAVVSRVKEGHRGPEAARLVAENLGLDLSDVVEIVAENSPRRKR